MEELINELTDDNPDAVVLIGYNKAIIGIADRINLKPVLIYSIDKIIEILIDGGIENYDEAMEFYEYNIYRTFIGEDSPIFLRN